MKYECKTGSCLRRPPAVSNKSKTAKFIEVDITQHSRTLTRDGGIGIIIIIILRILLVTYITKHMKHVYTLQTARCFLGTRNCFLFLSVHLSPGTSSFISLSRNHIFIVRASMANGFSNSA